MKPLSSSFFSIEWLIIISGSIFATNGSDSAMNSIIDAMPALSTKGFDGSILSAN
jgi:hypothetical protein